MSLKRWMAIAALATSFFCGVSSAADVTGLPDFTRIVAAEGPAVVNVSTSRIERQAANGLPDAFGNDPFFEFFRRFAPPQMREREVGSLGSGFIISADGYVLTNAHVVAKAEKITVTLTDKREFKARLIGSDERTDVALLKIEGANLPLVKLGKSSSLQVGQWVLAIGSPFGLDNSVTSGIVSALGRQLPDDSYVPFIQTDAAVNPGNSGGPLFNMNGEVVGINSQILSRSGGFMGISLAIPIDVALEVADQLKAHGKVARGRIGVTLQPLTKELADSFGLARPDGVLVVQVDPKGPAARGGLRVGDIITAVNQQPVGNSGDLQRVIGMAKPGTRFNLQIWRDKASHQVALVSDEFKETPADSESSDPSSPPSSTDRNLSQIGLVVSPLTPQQRQQLGITFGVLVRAVSAGSARAGLAPGDVIVGIAGEPLTSVKQLESAIQGGKGSLALQVMRQGNLMFIAIALERGE
ncbi:MAG: DegQ family serine endoprotease [Paludibacterium sp.]|uniref:DegQ family serine endoprotease n=1 Tax=Paludibacterium sp. TaxID=1917523 RepID=UPI0025DD2808|nr:DegQ family serine endoprotease [Paludibacterium sp.]MBV8045623.1 DegQ family serine endoprotease [Paludibacterium sp.]MBV8647202.1 DegQ family serine endoprotease [Paludibacterium sp.]